MDFLLGGCAATCAGFFSNPFDVIKTRQQLHGELLQRNGQTGPAPNGPTGRNPYSSVVRSFRSILRSEGVLGLQKGLVSALAFQFAMNSVRLGIYQTAENCEWTRGDTQATTLLRSIAWGGLSGVVGSTIACPLYMVKTQIQARSHGKYAVGYQHRHTSTLDALTGIYRTHGVRGLWRGYPGIVTRTAVGSSAQLATFSTCKDLFQQFDWARESVAITAFAASMVSGFFTCVFMSPFDVIATRLFNQGVDAQGRGLLYRSVVDCFTKTLRAEGLHGLYKGFVPNYWRIAPHTILNLTFWDQFKAWRDLYYGY
ncbi:solute carrier family 25 member 35-like [Anopheles maculipalpis]|uniref:solute carrier family 25 member 35-like n=1 Tax=Anopheles maculipalpis TaxID=1496333 RepID=UPI0021598E8D|nr:solute carrier family 25 member 35-like [Anopheles maculipalpis]